ncbi:MAG: glycosyltransferase family 4 protein [Puia sp.]|nr:glycosyltransferase family 4 protein [Puia sp.]
MEKHLHIVCLDTPYPVDYGGVFDLFHKISSLHEAGVSIHLHCFEYGRGEQPELNKYCVEVNYYSRCKGHKGFSHKLPYIVCSRSDGRLTENLLADRYPILLEGIHCSYLLNDERFEGRRIVLRLHNVEYQYYRQLFLTEKSWFKKLYYWHESHLLRRYERKIANKVLILSVSQKDSDLYRKEFGAAQIFVLPVFLPFKDTCGKEGNGCFCLYHGNLSVAENEQAVEWLLKKVFKDLELPFIITGKNPSPRLQRMVSRYPHACLIANPTEQEMQDMISKAQINILPSFNCTGIKLKLLNALYNGRHCIVNEEAVKCSGLEDACHVASHADDIRNLVRNLYNQPFTGRELESRRKLLKNKFDNERNAHRLIEWIWHPPQR